ncbi:hypothetical protein VPHD273_0084 [Vibrio phage D273]|nr:hypothetical protein PODOV060v1_p0031 [Vibrio phage 234P8]QZI91581.1 hypothetical protein PODOV087v1_p0076 [Vibrio phage 431E45.1]QZI91635.1 hypothetical protein PODOV086v1_p0051 [Vibrio phage 431E46.1]QZI91668.1 hypothetical protein PODOV088v1_p0007 [Vibrio phage 431E48.2]
MDYLITNLIDELLWQIEDISFYAVIGVGYFATAIAQYAGKYAALRENDKALNPIANAFYAGAVYGLVYSQHHPKIQEPRWIVTIYNRLELAHYKKQQTY